MADERGLKFEGKGDAYLEWGYATKFADFRERDNDTIGLLVEWNSESDAADAVKVTEGFHVARVYKGDGKRKPRLTWALAISLPRLDEFFANTKLLIRALELSAPLRPTRRNPGETREIARTDKPILAGVLDDGCPFANRRFSDGVTTRIQWMWNQDASASGAALDGQVGPSSLTNFNYGAQHSKTELEKLLIKYGDAPDRIYVETGLKALPEVGIESLRRAASHGAHVMDLLAGQEPSWPIVFVQFARRNIEDPTGLWLQSTVLDGLHYILETAGPDTKKVLANVSWGPQTGPHDGSTLLEREIDRLVVEHRARADRELIVSLPAGNAFGSRAHASIGERAGGDVTWVVPPEATVSTFLEIWWPKNVQLTDVGFGITPPFGPRADAKANSFTNLGTWSILLFDDAQGRTRALVSIDPTGRSDPMQRGMHGRWTVHIGPRPGAPVEAKVDIYIPRADPNLGAKRRAQPSYLTDHKHEAWRFCRPDERFGNAPGSAIDRRGTLSGIATGEHSKVATGYVYRALRPAPYASAGGSRGLRKKPDFACMTDWSLAVPGVRATGNRSGTKVRLIGTSTAAPQMARQLATALEAPFDLLPQDFERNGDPCLTPKPELTRPS